MRYALQVRQITYSPARDMLYHTSPAIRLVAGRFPTWASDQWAWLRQLTRTVELIHDASWEYVVDCTWRPGTWG